MSARGTPPDAFLARWLRDRGVLPEAVLRDAWGARGRSTAASFLDALAELGYLEPEQLGPLRQEAAAAFAAISAPAPQQTRPELVTAVPFGASGELIAPPEVTGAPLGASTTGGSASGEMGVPEFEGYVIEAEINRGGMGAVLRARRVDGELRVALKVILSREPEPALLSRFELEARTLARLDHPNVVRVRDYGRQQGLPYMAMDLVEGRPLSDVIASSLQMTGRPPEPAWTVGVFRQIADALAHCHARGVIHRDLKPANILIEAGTDRPVLVDFGIVKRTEGDGLSIVEGLTATGEVMGTPAYMAPEQLDEGGEVGPETDVWGLAACLFDALTGQPPYGALSVVNVYKKLTTEDPPGPRKVQRAVPDWLDGLCRSCLLRKRGARLSLDEVRKALADEALEVEPPAPKGPLIALLGGFALVLILAAAGWSQRHRLDAVRPVITLNPSPKSVGRRQVEVSGRVVDDWPGELLVRVGAESPARVLLDADGRFQASVSFSGEAASIAFVATDAAGNQSAREVIEVSLDEQPPSLELRAAEGPFIEVDVVLRGRLSEDGCAVEARRLAPRLDEGIPGVVSGRDLVLPLPLAAGENRFELELEDAVGNRATQALTLTRWGVIAVGEGALPEGLAERRVASIPEALEAAGGERLVLVLPGRYELPTLALAGPVVIRGYDPKARATSEPGAQANVVLLPRGDGLSVVSGTVILEDLAISREKDEAKLQLGLFKVPALAVSGGEAILRRCTVTSREGVGIKASRESVKVSEKARLRLEDSVLRGCPDHGLQVAANGVVTILRSAIRGCNESNIAVEFGGMVKVQDSEVSGAEDDGLYVDTLGEAEVTGSRFEGNGDCNIRIEGGRARLTLARSKLLKSDQDRANAPQPGLKVRDGAMATATGCLFEGSARGDGVLAQKGAKVELVGCEMRDNPADGVAAESGARVTLRDCKVIGNRGHGLRCDDSETVISVDGATELRSNGEGPQRARGGGRIVEAR